MTSPPFIVDSHIHLWDDKDLDKLAWCTPSHALARRCLPSDYVDALNGNGDDKEAGEAEADADGHPPARGPRAGYVFIESDRKNNDGDDWTEPLAEVAFLRRLVEAEDAAGASASQARCLGIVPWAPVHRGPEVLAKYLDAVKEAAGPVAWPRVRGVRYLLQDKPHGTMLTDDFVAGLQLLGRRGLAFDLGVDQRRRGRVQLDEAVALVERVYADVPEAEKVVLVVNHLAKPDMSMLNPAADRTFAAWRSALFALGKASPHVYAKVSGLFSEMPRTVCDQSVDAFLLAAQPWLAVLLAAFGPSRMMFGSDWPVCTAAFAAPATDDDDGDTPRTLNKAETGAVDKWRRIVGRLCYMASLSDDDVAMIWGGTAVQAYGLGKKD